MPKYDIKCGRCDEIREARFSFAEFDLRAKGFSELCPTCHEPTFHSFVITQVPAIEWRTDGVTTTDWADPHTKYQREHFQESGTRSEERRHKKRKS